LTRAFLLNAFFTCITPFPARIYGGTSLITYYLRTGKCQEGCIRKSLSFASL
jgi:hypothetical protein